MLNEEGKFSDFMMSAEIKTGTTKSIEILNAFLAELKNRNIIYSVDYEIESDNTFEEHTVKHPDFEKFIK